MNPKTTIAFCIILIWAVVMLQFIEARQRYHFWFRGEVLIALYAFGHHLLAPVGILCGIIDDGEDLEWIMTGQGAEAVVVVSIGIISILFGGHFARVIKRTHRCQPMEVGSLAFVQAGTFVLVSSVVFMAAVHFATGGSYYTERALLRIGTAGANWWDRLLHLSSKLTASSIMVVAISSLIAYKRLFPNKFVVFLFVAVVGASLLQGGRGGLVALIIVLLWYRAWLHRPVPIRYLAPVLVFGIFISSIVQTGRSLPRYHTYEGIIHQMTEKVRRPESDGEAYLDYLGIRTAVKSSHGPLLSVKNTIFHVDSTGSLAMGRGYLIPIVVGLPFGTKLFPHYLSYNLWCAIYKNPQLWREGRGVGGSVFGEAYFNFSLPGVIIVSALSGFVCSLATAKLNRHSSIVHMAIFGVLLHALLCMVRNDFCTFARYIYFEGFGVLTVILIAKLLPEFRRNPTQECLSSCK